MVCSCSMMGCRFFVGLVLLFLLGTQVVRAQDAEQRIYVDVDAVDDNPDGSTWEKAYTDLTEALREASEFSEVWVAAGIYYPSSATEEEWPDISESGKQWEQRLREDRYRTFILKTGIRLYGGFRGDEENIYQRNVLQNRTILNGDVGIRSKGYDNSFHVIWIPRGVEGDIVIDGFTITGGNALGYSLFLTGLILAYPNARGTGVDPLGPANYSGTAIAAHGGNSVTILNCQFTQNAHQVIYFGDAQAIYSARREGYAHPETRSVLKVHNSFFFGNIADRPPLRPEACIYLEEGEAVITHNTFYLNEGAAVILDGESSTSTIVGNNIFFQGTAIYNWSKAEFSGNYVRNYGGLPTQEAFTKNIVNESLAFVETVDNTKSDFLRPNRFSATIDKGFSHFLSEESSLDYGYASRPFAGTAPDVGAYEYVSFGVVRVSGYEPVDFAGGSEVSIFGAGFKAGDVDAYRVLFSGRVKEVKPHYVGPGEIRVIAPPGVLAIRGIKEGEEGVVSIVTRVPRMYLDANNPPGGDGVTWKRASSRISALVGSAPPGTEFWVKQGEYGSGVRYYPGYGGPPTVTLGPGQSLYGGFIGNETSLEERDPTRNKTILSGFKLAGAVTPEGRIVPLDHPDANKITPERGDRVSTVNRILVIPPSEQEVVVDGFTLRDATATEFFNAGIYGWFAPVLVQSVSSLIFSNNRIVSNIAVHNSGMAILGETNYVLYNTIIAGNRSEQRDGFRQASSFGAAIGVGLILETFRPGENIVLNCTVAGNLSIDTRIIKKNSSAGGIFIQDSDDVVTRVINTVVHGNEANFFKGVQVRTTERKSKGVFFQNCLIENYESDLVNVPEEHKVDLLDASPQFVSPDLGSRGYLRPSAGSLLVDGGADYSVFLKYVPSKYVPSDKDLSGGARRYLGDQGKVDIGAYEYPGSPLRIVSVSPQAVSPGGTVQFEVETGYPRTEYNEEDLYKFEFPFLDDGYVSSDITSVDYTTGTFTVTVPDKALTGRPSLVFLGNRAVLSDPLTILSGDIYVDSTIDGGDGSSWDKAVANLLTAIKLSSPGVTIKVAGGVYKPSAGHSADNTISYSLEKSLRIEGGYPPKAERLKHGDGRDIDKYRTVLSGEIGQKTFSDNTLNLIWVNARGEKVVLDGLTLSRGYSLDSPDPRRVVGSAVYLESGNLELYRCRIIDNTSLRSAIYTAPAAERIALIQCIFYENSVREGHLLEIQSASGLVLNCTFYRTLRPSGEIAPHIRLGKVDEEVVIANTIFYTDKDNSFLPVLENSSYENILKLFELLIPGGLKGIKGDINDESIIRDIQATLPDMLEFDEKHERFLSPSRVGYPVIDTGADVMTAGVDFAGLVLDEDIYGTTVPRLDRIDVGA
ncbi:MAG: right-handed parallel beta-helix repeat-containing protein, partial [Cytophagales bacterium]|nr:right-handed parallel beta-helix repeat-containing protein [Cytophagales bacterium]